LGRGQRLGARAELSRDSPLYQSYHDVASNPLFCLFLVVPVTTNTEITAILPVFLVPLVQLFALALILKFRPMLLLIWFGGSIVIASVNHLFYPTFVTDGSPLYDVSRALHAALSGALILLLVRRHQTHPAALPVRTPQHELQPSVTRTLPTQPQIIPPTPDPATYSTWQDHVSQPPESPAHAHRERHRRVRRVPATF
jgi:hypothetical protein